MKNKTIPDPLRVLVAMSGGVDSAVCALLLKQKGYSVEGLTMKLWSDTEPLHDEHSPLPDQNCRDAMATAEQLEIPHHCVAFGDTFRSSVVTRFIDEYVNGRTPNPCVECNRCIKFGKLLRMAEEWKFDRLATGHYARLERSGNGAFLLKKAKDLKKDQSYFLWGIPKEDLSKIIFPLGDFSKEEIRAIASAHKLFCAHRSDSQDICFVPSGDYISFIQRQTDLSFPCGSFVGMDGTVLGQHSGLIRYTVGQRKGLGIALGQPMFVGRKNTADNTVTLCTDSELYSKVLTASELNLLVDDSLSVPQRMEAKIRYRHTPATATVTRIDEKRIHVCFDEPQRAIAPGQSVVLYDGDTVIGGAIID